MGTDFQRESNFPFDLGNLPNQIGDRLKWGSVVVVLVVLFAAVTLLRSVYTDVLWFDQLDFRSVYMKVLLTRVALFAAGAVLFGVLLAVALFFANRVSRGPEEIPLPQATRDFLRLVIRWGPIAAAIVLSVVFGAIMSAQWESWLKLVSGVSFGAVEPVAATLEPLLTDGPARRNQRAGLSAITGQFTARPFGEAAATALLETIAQRPPSEFPSVGPLGPDS